jgi:hypothetical protein
MDLFFMKNTRIVFIKDLITGDSLPGTIPFVYISSAQAVDSLFAIAISSLMFSLVNFILYIHANCIS